VDGGLPGKVWVSADKGFFYHLSNLGPAIRRDSKGRHRLARRQLEKENIVTQYLVAIHNSDDYDPSIEGDSK
jgi:hypothetical protein